MPIAQTVFVLSYVAGLLVRDCYELLKKAGRIDPTDPRVFALVFTSMCVMWISWFGIGFASAPRLSVAPPVRWAGIAGVAAGTMLAVGGMVSLRGVENIDHLVTTGLFSKLRHPMYVGFTLWIAGALAWTGSVPGLVVAPLGLASTIWWRHLEEQELESRYGEAYTAYRKTTWV